MKKFLSNPTTMMIVIGVVTILIGQYLTNRLEEKGVM